MTGDQISIYNSLCLSLTGAEPRSDEHQSQSRSKKTQHAILAAEYSVKNSLIDRFFLGGNMNLGGKTFDKIGYHDRALIIMPEFMLSLKARHFNEQMGDYRQSWCSCMSASDMQLAFSNDIELQMLHQQGPLVPNASGEDDNGVDPDYEPLLIKYGTSKAKDHKWYHHRQTSLRMYCYRARDIVVQPWWRIANIFDLILSFRMAFSIKKFVLGYDHLDQPTLSRCISEQDFWVLMQGFFGFGPHPFPSLWHSSAPRDRILYIKSYLKSKPTPVEPGDGKDEEREMVKICTRLTEMVFQNDDSKRIFLGVDSRTHSPTTVENWDIFQGFGIIRQYCDEVGQTNLDADNFELQTAWLQSKRMPSREGQYMLQVWESLQYLLSTARQPDPARNMTGGLREIYQILLTANGTGP